MDWFEGPRNEPVKERQRPGGLVKAEMQEKLETRNTGDEGQNLSEVVEAEE